jgi:hypothetical protein
MTRVPRSMISPGRTTMRAFTIACTPGVFSRIPTRGSVWSKAFTGDESRRGNETRKARAGTRREEERMESPSVDLAKKLGRTPVAAGWSRLGRLVSTEKTVEYRRILIVH